MVTDESFLNQIHTMSMDEIQLMLENDRPGERNLLLLTSEESFEYTENFVNNNHDEIIRLNQLMEERRKVLEEHYRKNLH